MTPAQTNIDREALNELADVLDQRRRGGGCYRMALEVDSSDSGSAAFTATVRTRTGQVVNVVPLAESATSDWLTRCLRDELGRVRVKAAPERGEFSVKLNVQYVAGGKNGG